MNSYDMQNTVVPIIAILAVFGLPIGYLIIHRLLSYNERMAMIRQGMVPPPDSRWARRAASEGWYNPTGSMPPNAGPLGGAFYGADLWRAQRKLQKGVSLTLIGFALTVCMAVARPTHSHDLLIGLIPMFMGLAQMANAWLMGARFGPDFRLGRWGAAPPPGAQGGPPPYGQRPAAAPPTGTEGPYAWRPGGVREIEPPIKPPKPNDR